jgi:hypothetical protein
MWDVRCKMRSGPEYEAEPLKLAGLVMSPRAGWMTRSLDAGCWMVVVVAAIVVSSAASDHSLEAAERQLRHK